jgi:hypothetical protein
MTIITIPNTPLNWPAEGDITVTAAVFFLAGEPPQASAEDYARIVHDQLIAEAKRARVRAPAHRSALMQNLDKAVYALLEHARAGRLTLFGRPIDDILGARKAVGGIEKILSDRLHSLLVIDLRRNQLEPDIARADLSFGDFEALRTDRGFDLLRVSIAEVRSLMAPASGRQPKPQQVRALVEGDPNRFSASLPYKARIAEIQQAYLKTHGEDVSETSIKKGLLLLSRRRAPPRQVAA